MEEADDIPQLPEPWRPIEAPNGPSSSPTPGCASPLLVGCGVVLLALGLASAAVVIKADDIMRWSYGQTERVLTESLPTDVSPDEKQRLHDAFESLGDAWESGSLDASKVGPMQSELGQAMRATVAESLSRQDVLELIEAIEGVAGSSGASP